MTAETFVADLISFSLTEEISEGRVNRRIYSNFNSTIRAIMEGFDRIPDMIRANIEARKADTRGIESVSTPI